MIPAVGSIQWAVKHGTAFHVDGIYQCGQVQTMDSTHQAAAQASLRETETYCTWVPNGTRLTVHRITGGSTGGFTMADEQVFTVQDGKAVKEENGR